jgi:hypothetical protein
MKTFPVASLIILLASLMPVTTAAVTKPHFVTLGKWTAVPWSSGLEDSKAQTLKVRALIIDGRVKEYIFGAPHEVTDRLFVARRAFRINDSLPEDANPRWLWQRGGWLLIDRMTGRVSAINLPEFDAFYSAASWYRDYVAYCGVSDDGKKTFAMVAQVSRKKPVLKKVLSGDGMAEDAAPDSACSVPVWQRMPVQVSFEPAGRSKRMPSADALWIWL